MLAIGFAAYVLWHSAQVVEDKMSQRNPPASATEPEGLEPGASAANPLEPRTTLLSARPRGAVDAAEQRKLAASEVTIPHDVVMQDYKTDLWAEILAQPPEVRQPGDPALDADTAYRLYMYFGNCSVLLGRGHQIDQQIEKIASRAETADGRFLEDLEGRLNEIMDYYELCEPIPADVDARMEAVIWMSEAVRLGHEIAEAQFYQKAMGFLLRPDSNANSPPLAMTYPGLVEDFKTTARLGLARALEKGHPEAYLAKSRAVLEGLIYKKDPVLAYAYARKAELEAAKSQMIVKDIGIWKQEAARYLSREKIAEAEQLALEMKSP
jgi:TPR repeat protein